MNEPRDAIRYGYDRDGNCIWLPIKDDGTHKHTCGASGSGKSKHLQHLIREYSRLRVGWAAVDPHGQLYDDVMADCSYRVYRDFIPLNLSEPGDTVICLNPFERSASGDLSVQVDRRVDAIMHAWGVRNMDETPTLARVLRLVISVMLETDLGLLQVAHLIDFSAQRIRAYLIEQIQTPLVQKEWRELQALKAREWREEVLSTKNRLFKFLTSTTLARVIGVKGHSLDLQRIMDGGTGLCINLAPSDYLSRENAHAFGALFLTVCYESAMHRKRDPITKRPPRAYQLILDEFQHFVSPTIAAATDELRKFGLFLHLSHQRFSRLDPDLVDAVLTNCQIKAVFGGLPAASAKMMAEELFLNQVDPTKVKLEIRQTAFRPVYARDKTYTRSRSFGTTTSHLSTESSGTGFSDGTASNRGAGRAYSYDDDGSRTGHSLNESTGQSVSFGSSSSLSHSESTGEAESRTESESESDIPSILSEPFEQLSSVQYYSVDEQLTQFTAALKFQPQRQFVAKLPGHDAHILVVPFVQDHYVSKTNQRRLKQRQLQKHGGLPVSEIDLLLKAQEDALLKAAEGRVEPQEALLAPAAAVPRKRIRQPTGQIWSRVATSSKSSNPEQPRRARGEDDE